MRPRVVLVTGVSRYLGGRIAALLQADPEIERVVGVDTVPPKGDLGRTEFLRADIRNPLIAKVLAAASVDTVVHMNVIATPLGAGGRKHLGDQRVADVSPDELRAPEVPLGGDGVHADDPLDLRVGLQQGGDAPAQVPRNAGDENDARTHPRTFRLVAYWSRTAAGCGRLARS